MLTTHTGEAPRDRARRYRESAALLVLQRQKAMHGARFGHGSGLPGAQWRRLEVKLARHFNRQAIRYRRAARELEP